MSLMIAATSLTLSMGTFQEDIMTTIRHLMSHEGLSIIEQALRKFSETAKGWYWNIDKLYRKYAVKLYPMILVVNLYILLVYCCTMLLNFMFCSQPLSYDSGCQP